MSSLDRDKIVDGIVELIGDGVLPEFTKNTLKVALFVQESLAQKPEEFEAWLALTAFFTEALKKYYKVDPVIYEAEVTKAYRRMENILEDAKKNMPPEEEQGQAELMDSNELMGSIAGIGAIVGMDVTVAQRGPQVVAESDAVEVDDTPLIPENEVAASDCSEEGECSVAGSNGESNETETPEEETTEEANSEIRVIKPIKKTTENGLQDPKEVPSIDAMYTGEKRKPGRPGRPKAYLPKEESTTEGETPKKRRGRKPKAKAFVTEDGENIETNV